MRFLLPDVVGRLAGVATMRDVRRDVFSQGPPPFRGEAVVAWVDHKITPQGRIRNQFGEDAFRRLAVGRACGVFTPLAGVVPIGGDPRAFLRLAKQ
ncbi:MAG: hypothetical protein SFZ23_07380 [Planctomycetota bacterium]|nr:hypothetical protein [Planctomycetota bacterium]